MCRIVMPCKLQYHMCKITFEPPLTNGTLPQQQKVKPLLCINIAEYQDLTGSPTVATLQDIKAPIQNVQLLSISLLSLLM